MLANRLDRAVGKVLNVFRDHEVERLGDILAEAALGVFIAGKALLPRAGNIRKVRLGGVVDELDPKIRTSEGQPRPGLFSQDRIPTTAARLECVSVCRVTE